MTELDRLAAHHRVATWYSDGAGHRVDVHPDVVAEVLGLLGVPAGSAAEVRESLAAARRPKLLPGTIAIRQGASRPLPGRALLRDEQGDEWQVEGLLPRDLTLGWYRIEQPQQETTLVVAPSRLPDPPRTWGWMLQLYALHSGRSAGIGDYADLRDFVSWAADSGAGAVLVNPLHAITPVPPVQRSPYTPSSRRFHNPLHLAVPGITAPVGDLIDHDGVWRLKHKALQDIWRDEGRPVPEMSEALTNFATFCALAERHGTRWRQWPAELRHPDSPAVRTARSELADDIAFHSWLQQRCQAQLREVRAAAAPMAIGVLHDLAVGVDPDGADAWALQDVLAVGASVGAPPDAFSPGGQDWGLPPWRPDALDATGYAAYRDTLRAVLSHSDGVRIDHVMGLWRLWWIPAGSPPGRGTYVGYDDEVMLAVLALEAHRAGAVVVGEDLGTVEARVTDALERENMLGSAVMWFCRDPDGTMWPPSRWPERAVATVSTHDLPTATGFLRDTPVTTRVGLGLVADETAERARATQDRTALLDLLRSETLIGAHPSEEEIIAAMHELLAAARSRVRLVSPYDVLGVERQPNLPGTVDEYPNWRMPLPLPLEELRTDPRVARIAEVMDR